jgi:cysteine-rich repeat protein
MPKRLGLALVFAGLAASPLHASFHEVNIVQLYAGTSSDQSAQYIMLQMWAPGQNMVGGQSLTIFNGDGSLAATLTFPAAPGGNLPNGSNQDTFLIGTAAAQTLFGVSMDLLISPVTTTGQGVKICWAGTYDCVAVGNYTGDTTGVGTPFAMGDLQGLALSRRLDVCTGVSATPGLDLCDDTNDSANDFILTLPSPRNNARETGTLPVSTCGNHVVEGLETCDDGNTTSGDGCSSTCRVEAPGSAPLGVRVDHVASGTSDGNTVLEPGETVTVAPIWHNPSGSPLTLSGAAYGFTGPAGPTYDIKAGLAKYGTIAPGADQDCTAGGLCYQFSVSAPGARPSARPATHWDATFNEQLTGGATKNWTLHIGESFTDVPRSQLFYKRIEVLLHNAITAGCTATTYCPGDPVARSQMAIFIAKGIAKGGANVPASGTVGTDAYNCSPGGTSLFSDVTPTDIFCKHVHYIAAQNVTLGCATGKYCPTDTVTRLQMASFIAKAIVAPQGGTGVSLSYGPDPVTGFQYSCDAGSPNTHFTDVPATDIFCKHVHFLWAKGIIGGCSATEYCPADAVTRDAMAKFLANAFQLTLYGP